MPIIGQFVKFSGAIPVYRQKEHGDKAKDFNFTTFRAVYKGLLEEGKCIAFAPEGVSRFVSYATKFKSGIAFIAIEVILRAKEKGDLKFELFIQPAIMSWTHREKFRSDVLVRFEQPIRIDWEFIKSLHPESEKMKVDEISEIKKIIATKIIDKVESIFERNMISSPDWDSIKSAITAVRIHRPRGTYFSLSTYFYMLYGWLEILKSRRSLQNISDQCPDVKLNLSKEENDLVEATFVQLQNYQKLIDSVKVKDDRLRKLDPTNPSVNLFSVLWKIIYRSVLSLLLISIAAPGLIIWSPFWSFIKKKEKQLLAQGRTWVDSIAEHKMLFGTGFVAFLILLAIVASQMVVLPMFFPIFVVGYLWLTMRLYEEFVACVRSIFGLFRLSQIEHENLSVIMKERGKTVELVQKCLQLFPRDIASKILLESGEDVTRWDVAEMQRESNLKNFNLFRRRKKDWNEVLRLSDYCTMDYVE